MKLKGVYKAISFKRDLTKDEILYVRQMVQKNLVPVGLPIHKIYTVENIVPLVGRKVIARRLAGDTTYTGQPNYLMLGSASTTFTEFSTTLGTEVYRKELTDIGHSGAVAYLDCIIESGDVADQTFNEAGIVIDGTASADTGQALSLVATGGWAKSGSIYISFTITATS